MEFDSKRSYGALGGRAMVDSSFKAFPRSIRRMGTRLGVLTLVGGLFILPGCSEEEKPREAKAPVVRNVSVETVRLQKIDETIEAVGGVKSRQQSVLSSKIVAAVVAVRVREGDRVKAGQVLVELDDRDLRAELERAEAALRETEDGVKEVESSIQAAERAVQAAVAQEELARATFDRYKMLVERQVVARQLYDEAAARHKAAQAEVSRAKEVKASLVAKKRSLQARIDSNRQGIRLTRVQLGYSRILAPFDGIVVAKSVEQGVLASPGQPLLTLEEESYRLEALVPESEIGKLRIGQKGQVSLPTINREVSGAIEEIVPIADPATRTFTVKVNLPDVPGMRSGLFGRATFAVGQRERLTVPAKAVMEREQLQSLYVLDAQNVARLRLVKTGKTYGDRVEILSGLTEGERVATAEIARLSDGTRVEP